jgi:hypothetical protein
MHRLLEVVEEPIQVVEKLGTTKNSAARRVKKVAPGGSPG